MKERPILFNGEMVRAILKGCKTQTRRICEEHLQIYNSVHSHHGNTEFDFHFRDGIGQSVKCGYGQPGDRLWVRETIRQCAFARPAYYEADGKWLLRDGKPYSATFKRNVVPSIHMPRWASRITLEIVNVRVERLHDIDAADAYREGIREPLPVKKFQELWKKINGPGAWDKNPWVWVIEFKKL